MVLTFAGTVVECCTRYQVKKSTTAYLTHFDANWILTILVDAADDGLPLKIGQEKSFAIHSPVQLLFDSAEECVGKHYKLAVDVRADRPDWRTLRRS